MALILSQSPRHLDLGLQHHNLKDKSALFQLLCDGWLFTEGKKIGVRGGCVGVWAEESHSQHGDGDAERERRSWVTDSSRSPRVTQLPGPGFSS